jgi:hypothetical protein
VLEVVWEQVTRELGRAPDDEGGLVLPPRHDVVGAGVVHQLVRLGQERRRHRLCVRRRALHRHHHLAAPLHQESHGYIREGEISEFLNKLGREGESESSRSSISLASYATSPVARECVCGRRRKKKGCPLFSSTSSLTVSHSHT